MQKVEQKNQGKPEGSARFALPTHSNSHDGLISVYVFGFLLNVSRLLEGKRKIKKDVELRYCRHYILLPVLRNEKLSLKRRIRHWTFTLVSWLLFILLFVIPRHEGSCGALID